MRVVALAAVLAVTVALPGAALAKGETIAPPGNSGVQQYDETIPTAHGGRPTSTVHPGGVGPGNSGGSNSGGGGSSSGGGGGGGGGGAISSATQRALTAQGAVGRQAAAVLSATAPSSVNHRRSAKPSIGAVQGSDAALSQGDGPSPATAVIKALTGSGSSGGLGPLLPIILAAAALAVCAVAISRRRRTS